MRPASAASSDANGAATAGMKVVKGGGGRAGLAVQHEAQRRELRLDDDAARDRHDAVSDTHRQRGQRSRAGLREAHRPSPSSVQVVLGIGIVTTIGVPETKAPPALTPDRVDAVTLSARTCVEGVAFVAATAIQTFEGMALYPARKIPSS